MTSSTSPQTSVILLIQAILIISLRTMNFLRISKRARDAKPKELVEQLPQLVHRLIQFLPIECCQLALTLSCGKNEKPSRSYFNHHAGIKNSIRWCPLHIFSNNKNWVKKGKIQKKAHQKVQFPQRKLYTRKAFWKQCQRARSKRGLNFYYGGLLKSTVKIKRSTKNPQSTRYDRQWLTPKGTRPYVKHVVAPCNHRHLSIVFILWNRPQSSAAPFIVYCLLAYLNGFRSLLGCRSFRKH